MREARSASTPTRSGAAASRGQLNERQWQDVRTALRIARSEGGTLKVHGVECAGPPVLGKGVKQQQHGSQAEPAGSTQLAAAGDESSPQPLSRRQQRSRNRLLEYQKAKRKKLLGASTLVQALLRMFRKQRMQNVWAAWVRRQQLRAKLRELLWRDWTRPLGHWSPTDVFDARPVRSTPCHLHCEYRSRLWQCR